MKNEEMARLFSEATPYIQKYHGKTMVVKYGGNAMINEELKNAVMNDLVTLTLLAVLREMLVRHRQVLAAVAVGNLGHLPIAEGLELPLRGDLGMNVFNSRALLFLRELGLSTAAVSFELRHQQIRDLKKYLPCEAVVYGRLPLMLMENCVIANSLGCCDVGSDYRKRSAACRCTGENVLTDRTGARFPLMPAWGHRNELENSRTLFLADKPEWRRLGLTYARLRFTTESPAECVAALQRYQGQGDYIPADLTRGLFYRGVE